MKIKLGGINALYPSLTTIVGVNVNGRPNFSAIAHVGIMNHGTPQYISIGVNKAHYSGPGIHENRTFSVNIPSEALVAETDYVGLVSGRNTDKSTLFEIFYGQTGTAPMIAACPVSLECRLDRIVDFERHEVFIGEIVEVYADEAILIDGKIDLARVRPLLFDMSSLSYWSLGSPVAGCWSVGKELKRRLKGGE